MNNVKQHITFKVATLFIIATLLAPTTIKLAHVFEHHEHKVCLGETSTHIHKVDFDCKFQKFQLNNHFLVSKTYKYAIPFQPNKKVLNLTYKFLNNHRPLSFSLRGPPVLV